MQKAPSITHPLWTWTLDRKFLGKFLEEISFLLKMKRGARRAASRRPPAKRIKRTPTVINPQARMSLLKGVNHASRPQWTRAELIYCESPVSLNPGAAGSAATYVFSANGVYDPNVTGAGHQPAGFDQYMALYNEYVVLGARCVVRFQNSDGSNAQIVGLAVVDNPTTSTDYRVYIENGWCKQSFIEANGSGDAFRTLVMDVSIDKFGKQNIYNDDVYAGTSSGNPAQQVYFHLFVTPVDQTADAGVVFASAEIRYDVVFRLPSKNALS